MKRWVPWIPLVGVAAALAAYAASTGATTKQIRTAAPGAVNLTSVSASEGSSLSVARADHTHSLSGTLPQAFGGTGAGALTCSAGQALTSNGTLYSCTAAGVVVTGFDGQALVADSAAAAGYRWGLPGIERRYGIAMTPLDSTSTNFAIVGALSAPTLSGTVAWTLPNSGAPAFTAWRSFTTAAIGGSTSGLIGSLGDSRPSQNPIFRARISTGVVSSAAVRYWVGLTSASLTGTAPPTASAASANVVLALASDTAVAGGHWILVTGDGVNWSGTDTGVAESGGNHTVVVMSDGATATAIIAGITTTKSTNLPPFDNVTTDLKAQVSVTTTNGAFKAMDVSTYGIDQN